MAKKTETAFPRTLYKSAERDDPTATKWGDPRTSHSGAFHSVVVENEDELEAALEMDYIDDFATARAMAPGDKPPVVKKGRLKKDKEPKEEPIEETPEEPEETPPEKKEDEGF